MSLALKGLYGPYRVLRVLFKGYYLGFRVQRSNPYPHRTHILRLWGPSSSLGVQCLGFKVQVFRV